MGKFFVREKARDDLVAHLVYLAENAPGDVVDRFLESAEVTFTEVASQPFIGAPNGCGICWAIADFQPDPIIDPTLALEAGRTLIIPSERVLTDVILGEARRR